jgi:hypothetical protein
MAEVSRKRGLTTITVDRAVGERLSQRGWEWLDRMARRMAAADDAAAREEGAPPQLPLIRKLSGKEWIAAELNRRPELRAMRITDAGRDLAEKSKAAPNCAKSLSVGRCKNLLRDVFGWPKKPRNSPKQRLK